jgi:hypothetical protein
MCRGVSEERPQLDKLQIPKSKQIPISKIQIQPQPFNPEGIVSSSPGLRGTSYPGCMNIWRTTLKGLRHGVHIGGIITTSSRMHSGLHTTNRDNENKSSAVQEPEPSVPRGGSKQCGRTRIENRESLVDPTRRADQPTEDKADNSERHGSTTSAATEIAAGIARSSDGLR